MGKVLIGHQHKVNILALNRVKLLNEKNQIILLSNLWKDNPAVFIFVRHFGCLGCSAHVQQVWSMKEQLEKNGTKIYFIGSGAPYLISEFKKEFNVADAEIFTDPALESFKAAGLLNANFDHLTTKAQDRFKELENQGYVNKIIKDGGSITQLGGVVAMKSPGIVTYHFISEHVGDFDQPQDWH